MLSQIYIKKHFCVEIIIFIDFKIQMNVKNKSKITVRRNYSDLKRLWNEIMVRRYCKALSNSSQIIMLRYVIILKRTMYTVFMH